MLICMAATPSSGVAMTDWCVGVAQYLDEVNPSSVSRDAMYVRGFNALKKNADLNDNEEASALLHCAVQKGHFLALQLIMAATKSAGQKYSHGSNFELIELSDPTLRLVSSLTFFNLILYGDDLNNKTARPHLSDWLSGDPVNYIEAAKWDSLYVFGPGVHYHLPQIAYNELLKLEHCDHFEPAKPFIIKISRYLTQEQIDGFKQSVETKLQEGTFCTE